MDKFKPVKYEEGKPIVWRNRKYQIEKYHITNLNVYVYGVQDLTDAVMMQEDVVLKYCQTFEQAQKWCKDYERAKFSRGK